MGNAPGSENSTQTPNDGKTPFQKKLPEEKCLLNVYEPADKKQDFSSVGFGVYHTGLEVYGTEYMFAGAEGSGSGSGIHSQTPRVSPPGSPWVYLKTVELGVTTLGKYEIADLISKMGSDFPANSYHLMSRNCNHFTDDFSKRITKGKAGIPSWVNRTANFGNAFFGPGGNSSAAPKAEVKPSVFQAGSGHRLDGAQNATASTSKSNAKAKTSNAATTNSNSGSAENKSKRNPWRDPNFMPGAKSANTNSSAGSPDRPASASVSSVNSSSSNNNAGRSSVGNNSMASATTRPIQQQA
jgi:hypothetical protein